MNSRRGTHRLARSLLLLGGLILDRCFEPVPRRRRPILRLGFALFAMLVVHAEARANPTPAPWPQPAGATWQPPERSPASVATATEAEAETSNLTLGDPLREGNRLFRAGELEAAVTAYRAQTNGDFAATIAYNLGTTLHHLGRLPEAVLWYRRAESRLNTDPWLGENLDRARLELGAPAVNPPWPVGHLARYPWLAPTVAAVLAWIGLGLALRRSRRRWAIACLGVSATIWIALVTLDRFGPRPAVVTTDCNSAIPAGSEVWVRPHSDGWLVSGGADTLCRPQSISLIDP